jgi:hypothetical protein
MLLKKIITGAIIIFSFIDGFCQHARTHEHISDDFKKVLMNCLKMLYPNDDFTDREVTMGSSVDTVRNYYHYNSFKLSFEGKEDSLIIINFGAYIEHSPVYMLVFKVSGDKIKNQLLLGNQSLKNDLESLQIIYSCWSLKIDEKYKLEILDIYLQAKQGRVKTITYNHIN